ncbi:MAG: hypothetical protein CMF22_11465 [Idiomarinaceae bacterium]|nr:hypothetical protein [Idiomarinaceae bacterium]|tara:strand:+ start:87914 stop:88420 length:507 start_codon:yes stop_codon:yes gene_type:complete
MSTKPTYEKQTRKLVESTLESINRTHPIRKAEVSLIEITFLMQTDLVGYIDVDTQGIEYHGLSRMNRAMFDSVLFNVVRPNKWWIENINDICLIDIKNTHPDDLFIAMSYNVAFQIMMTYIYYCDRLMDEPCNLEEAVSAYVTHWPHHSSVDYDTVMKQYIEYSNSTK